MTVEGDAGTTRSVAVAESPLDARSERVVALLHRLTGAPEDGLRASVAAMPAAERTHLAALADDILGDIPPTARA
jgi:hypothetical protein